MRAERPQKAQCLLHQCRPLKRHLRKKTPITEPKNDCQVAYVKKNEYTILYNTHTYIYIYICEYIPMNTTHKSGLTNFQPDAISRFYIIVSFNSTRFQLPGQWFHDFYRPITLEGNSMVQKCSKHRIILWQFSMWVLHPWRYPCSDPGAH